MKRINSTMDIDTHLFEQLRTIMSPYAILNSKTSSFYITELVNLYPSQYFASGALSEEVSAVRQ